MNILPTHDARTLAALHGSRRDCRGISNSFVRVATCAYSGIEATPRQVTFAVSNTGARAGAEIAEVYAILPQAAGEPFKRLIGFTKVPLAAGESKTVAIPLDAKLFSIFDESKDDWKLVPGDYTILVGGSSEELPLHATVAMHE